MKLHGTDVRLKALALLSGGARNADVGRLLGVPAGTVAYWRHRDRAERGVCPGRHAPPCPRCDGRELDGAAYAYLLGLYLGDGHIIRYSGHRVPSLMITCAEQWPGLMDECETAMRAVLPDNSVCRVRRQGCRTVKLYSHHPWCLFPQHGPGRKHERRIVLQSWQREIVDAHPWEFVRGLIHSDGCRNINWTTRLVGGVRKRYEYPRYWFTNVSDDIRRLYTDTLDRLGAEWKECTRYGRPYNISVARRTSVALMDAHIGPRY
ncbi:helix-turn-helix domain-containing protein [Streptomyces sp. WMMC940]|uniref:helix-turn-helix domain-containing protein n=1 Tax=Streptomyces sp. WMMC940 TaxID=3015153 RepID=UPI0022B64DA3|nr:helix-turn-helix domain-containing protein [Streptomyces sp. WMMC940]MCZ7460973.1 helix-turn-helix domain-containing protein [Streptomyces sp. WMMC940]